MCVCAHTLAYTEYVSVLLSFKGVILVVFQC